MTFSNIGIDPQEALLAICDDIHAVNIPIGRTAEYRLDLEESCFMRCAKMKVDSPEEISTRI